MTTHTIQKINKDSNQNITKLSNIRNLKRETIRKKHKKAFNINKSVGKTLKKPLVLKGKEHEKDSGSDKSKEMKTKKQKIILND
jgi:hypothetical protein